LPKIAKGLEFCLALTEADAGTNTLNTQAMAVKKGDEYVINGQKMFISGADRAKGMLLVTRTTPLEKVAKRTLGLSLFVVDLPDPAVEIIPIEKHGITLVTLRFLRKACWVRLIRVGILFWIL
jgi:acyl-CoA dehydrogenase